MPGAVNPNRPAKDNHSWDADQPVLEWMVKNGTPLSTMSELLQRTEGSIKERGRKTLGTIVRDGYLMVRPAVSKEEGPVMVNRETFDPPLVLKAREPVIMKTTITTGPGNGNGNGSTKIIRDPWETDEILIDLLNETRRNGQIMEEINSSLRKINGLLEKKSDRQNTLTGVS